MFEQQVLKSLFYVFYGGVAALNIAASIYLLFRRSNAFAPDVTSPVRLRRWAAAFFATSALSHLWNLPVLFLTSRDDVVLSYLIAGLLDCMTVGPLAIVMLLAMLQDYRRPLWPVAVTVAPFVVIMALCVANRSEGFLPFLYGYFVLFAIGFIIYMVRALRRYGRWLRDNYADLEHKEVWQSFVVLAIILSGLVIYTFDSEGLAYECFVQLIDVVFICYLLWRVETLSDLCSTFLRPAESKPAELERPVGQSKDIEELLQRHCIAQQLYLQHDLTLLQLAKAVGINRFYLSQHFSRRGTTYNAYINGLRVQHFIHLYHEAATARQPMTAQQLAYQSGFRNYNTFSSAFKRVMSLSASAWMKSHEKL